MRSPTQQVPSKASQCLPLKCIVDLSEPSPERQTNTSPSGTGHLAQALREELYVDIYKHPKQKRLDFCIKSPALFKSRQSITSTNSSLSKRPLSKTQNQPYKTQPGQKESHEEYFTKSKSSHKLQKEDQKKHNSLSTSQVPIQQKAVGSEYFQKKVNLNQSPQKLRASGKINSQPSSPKNAFFSMKKQESKAEEVQDIEQEKVDGKDPKMKKLPKRQDIFKTNQQLNEQYSRRKQISPCTQERLLDISVTTNQLISPIGITSGKTLKRFPSNSKDQGQQMQQALQFESDYSPKQEISRNRYREDFERVKDSKSNSQRWVEQYKDNVRSIKTLEQSDRLRLGHNYTQSKAKAYQDQHQLVRYKSSEDILRL